MVEVEWRPFLERWSRAILASPDVDAFGLPESAVEAAWLGYPPAHEAQILGVEARLALPLPPSYRAFLQVTNGWRHTGLAIARILPVEQIDTFGSLHPAWAAQWAAQNNAADYDLALDAVDYEMLPDTLAISTVGDGAIMLLNPAVQTAHGEWEAWLFADWYPGVVRYESFWSMLRQQLTSLEAVTRVAEGQVRPDDPPDAVLTKLPALLAALEERCADVAQRAEHPVRGRREHYTGQAEGLEHVLHEVRAVQAGARDPVEVQAALMALAERLDAAADSLETSLREGINVQGLLRTLGSAAQLLSSKGRMSDAVRRGARAGGLRQGAGVIRWYLGVD